MLVDFHICKNRTQTMNAGCFSIKWDCIRVIEREREYRTYSVFLITNKLPEIDENLSVINTDKFFMKAKN